MVTEHIESIIQHAQTVHNELEIICNELNKLINIDPKRAHEIALSFEGDLSRTIDMVKKARLKLPNAEGKYVKC